MSIMCSEILKLYIYRKDIIKSIMHLMFFYTNANNYMIIIEIALSELRFLKMLEYN